MKRAVKVAIFLVLLVLLAGIVKFNFSDSDIYAKDKNGKIVPIDMIKEDK